MLNLILLICANEIGYFFFYLGSFDESINTANRMPYGASCNIKIVILSIFKSNGNWKSLFKI